MTLQLTENLSAIFERAKTGIAADFAGKVTGDDTGNFDWKCADAWANFAPGEAPPTLEYANGIERFEFADGSAIVADCLTWEYGFNGDDCSDKELIAAVVDAEKSFAAFIGETYPAKRDPNEYWPDSEFTEGDPAFTFPTFLWPAFG